MSLPRPGHDYCPSCYGGPGGSIEECRCSKWCSECGGMTNHTTKRHEEAMLPECVSCGERIRDNDDPEARYCAPCWQEEMEWRSECSRDAQAKEANRNGN